MNKPEFEEAIQTLIQEFVRNEDDATEARSIFQKHTNHLNEKYAKKPNQPKN